jgi:hypothetical protein
VTPIRLASPLRAVTRGFYKMDMVVFQLEFSGPAGEPCEAVMRDGQKAAPPRLKIRDTSGKLVADEPFHYG